MPVFFHGFLAELFHGPGNLTPKFFKVSSRNAAKDFFQKSSMFFSTAFFRNFPRNSSWISFRDSSHKSSRDFTRNSYWYFSQSPPKYYSLHSPRSGIPPRNVSQAFLPEFFFLRNFYRIPWLFPELLTLPEISRNLECSQAIFPKFFHKMLL